MYNSDLEPWRVILNSITQYYINNSEKGIRERALDISVTSVELTPDFPYYDLGFRGFDYDSSYDSYKLYVDLSFLNSQFYKTYCNLTNFYISIIEVISNDLNIVISDIIYNQKLFFNIDLSSCTCQLYSTRLSLINLINMSDVDINLNFKHKEYSILFSIEEELEEIDKVIDSLNYLISKFNKTISLTLDFDTPYDLSLLFVYKLLNRLNKSSKLKLIK